MDTIIIRDLEVFFRVGVPDAERAEPQRLLVSVEMRRDLRAAAAGDDLVQTIDYFAVSRRIKGLGEGRAWKLIETLAEEIAQVVLTEFGPEQVMVRIKKFILPDTRWVAVELTR